MNEKVKSSFKKPPGPNNSYPLLTSKLASFSKKNTLTLRQSKLAAKKCTTNSLSLLSPLPPLFHSVLLSA